MLPANQRLECHGSTGAEVLDRLVEERELLVLESCVEVHLEHASALDDRAHVGVEEGVAVTPGGLGGEQRHVRIAQQVIGGGVAAEGDPDAGGEAEARAEAIDLDRLVKRLDHPPRERVQAHVTRGRFDQQHELIAPVSPDGVVRANHVLEPVGDDLQERVTGIAAQLLVELLEPVDVDEEGADHDPRLATGPCQHPVGSVQR